MNYLNLVIGIILILIYLYLAFFKGDQIKKSKYWYLGLFGSLLILAIGGKFLLASGLI